LGARLAQLTAVLAALAAALLAQPAAADPAAWRIAGERGGEVALLGSIHVLRARDYPLPPLVDQLYGRAETIVMELDLDDLDPATEQTAVLSIAALPAGETLSTVLDKKVYDLAQQRALGLGVDLKLLDHFQPWLVAITLTDVGFQKLGFDSEHGLERYLLGKAKSDRKEIVGLETLNQQLGIFAALSRKSQQAMLAQTLEELDSADATMSELEAAWREGHVETMADQLLSDFDNFPELYPELVTKRNAAWADALEKLLKDGHRYLVVVGALHLVGRDSVIEKLGARGHRVERIGAPH
jgi:hypothetical protein